MSKTQHVPGLRKLEAFQCYGLSKLGMWRVHFSPISLMTLSPSLYLTTYLTPINDGLQDVLRGSIDTQIMTREHYQVLQGATATRGGKITVSRLPNPRHSRVIDSSPHDSFGPYQTCSQEIV